MKISFWRNTETAIDLAVKQKPTGNLFVEIGTDHPSRKAAHGDHRPAKNHDAPEVEFFRFATFVLGVGHIAVPAP
jgi:hypothetical protein